MEISLYEYDKNYNFSRLAERNYNFYHTSREIFLSQRVDHFDKFFILFTKTAHLINAILIKTQNTRRLKKRREKIIQTPDAVCQHALLIVSDDRIRRKCLILFVTSSLSYTYGIEIYQIGCVTLKVIRL